MSKNYFVLHYIQNQLSEYDERIVKAVQRLFSIEDQAKEKQGCVIDSVVLFLIFKKYGINAEIHLGEICADGKQDAYHCWLTVNDKLFDIGIYGNSNYNREYYKGPQLNTPFINESFTNLGGIRYIDGSTESDSWLSELSEKSVLDYVKKCPNDRVNLLICKALDISHNRVNCGEILKLTEGEHFPSLEELKFSPSGKATK